MYTATFARVFPAYAATFVALVALQVGGARLAERLGWLDTAELMAGVFTGVVLPVFAGSLLTAWAIPAMAARVEGYAPVTNPDGEASGTSGRGDVLASAASAASLALILAFLVPAGALWLPMVMGPPILVHAIVLEGHRYRDARARSGALLRGSWARVMLYLLTFSLGVGLVAYAAFALIATILVEVGGRQWALVIPAGIVQGAALPFMTAATVAVYLELHGSESLPR